MEADNGGLTQTCMTPRHAPLTRSAAQGAQVSIRHNYDDVDDPSCKHQLDFNLLIFTLCTHTNVTITTGTSYAAPTPGDQYTSTPSPTENLHPSYPS
jgi:hypothetical protein